MRSFSPQSGNDLVFDLREASDFDDVRRRLKELRSRVSARETVKIDEFRIAFFMHLRRHGEASGLWRGVYIAHETPDVLFLPSNGGPCSAFEITRVFPGCSKEEGERIARRDRLYRNCQDAINSYLQIHSTVGHLSVSIGFNHVDTKELRRVLAELDIAILGGMILEAYESGAQTLTANQLRRVGIRCINLVTVHRHTVPTVERSICGFSRQGSDESIKERITHKKALLDLHWNRAIRFEDKQVVPHTLTLILYDVIEGDDDMVDERTSDLALDVSELDFFHEVVFLQAFGPLINIRRIETT